MHLPITSASGMPVIALVELIKGPLIGLPSTRKAVGLAAGQRWNKASLARRCTRRIGRLLAEKPGWMAGAQLLCSSLRWALRHLMARCNHGKRASRAQIAGQSPFHNGRLLAGWLGELI